MEKKLQMVDLHGQYLKIKKDIDEGIAAVLETCAFINGPQVKQFADALASYTGVRHAVPCANGTDALMISLMALGLRPGDEVVVPAFTYAASAEAAAILGLVPVMADVDPVSFNMTAGNIREVLTPKTRAVIPVHLFGQSCDMEPILSLADEYGLYVIEDNAQSLGAEYEFSDGTVKKTGAMGTMGCTSFFPSKNLGCYGDGGAILTDDDRLAESARMIASHGQKVKYRHSVIGCNSRLDTIQAVVLGAKLPHLDEYCAARREAAAYYTRALRNVEGLDVPEEMPFARHVYNQYTLRIGCGRRDELKDFLEARGIPSMIYYPLPLDRQEAFCRFGRESASLEVSRELASSVLSLPIHTELAHWQQDMVIDAVKEFFKQ